MVNHIEKRNGKIARFEPDKIRAAISKAVTGIHLEDSKNITTQIYDNVLTRLSGFNGDVLLKNLVLGMLQLLMKIIVLKELKQENF